MNGRGRYHLLSLLALLDLALCAAGFGAVAWLDGLLRGPGSTATTWSGDGVLALSVSAATFWLATPFWESGGGDAMRGWIEQFFTALGFILIVQSGLAYFFLISPISWWVILAGTVVTIVLLARVRQWIYPAVSPDDAGVVLVGYDGIAAALAPALGGRIAGVFETEAERVAPHLPYLGDPKRLEEVAAARRPGRIVLSGGVEKSRVPPQVLLALRFARIPIYDGADLYEDMLGRVPWDRLEPRDFLFSSPLYATRSVMALQAIYTNVIGLALLGLLSPLLAATALLVGLLSGRGPILESAECVGFQRIPFRRLRFRTRRRDGTPTRIGPWLARLHLADLPQLFNIIRGEMSLFGPPPARREFADVLCAMIPLYPQRFLVKPGILGWSQVNLRTSGCADEAERLEYDLYYVKRGSPALDLEICFRWLTERPFFSPREAGAQAAGTGR